MSRQLPLLLREGCEKGRATGVPCSPWLRGDSLACVICAAVFIEPSAPLPPRSGR